MRNSSVYKVKCQNLRSDVSLAVSLGVVELEDELRVTLTCPELGPIEVLGSDLFSCIVAIREKIEPDGWRLLINASRLNGYPSRMARATAGGESMYLTRVGRRVGALIRTLDAIPIEYTASVELQAQHWQDCGASDLRCSVDRVLGALLGLAVGDALGVPHEFSRRSDHDREQIRKMVGGGPFNLAPGQVTDDTHLAVCTAASIDEAGHHDSMFAALLLDWRERTFDCGGQVGAAIRALAAGDQPSIVGRKVWEETGRDRAGNGSLMRIAPIGVGLAWRDDLRRDAAFRNGVMTHADPRCIFACSAMVGMVASYVVGGRAVRPEYLRHYCLEDASHTRILLRALKWLREEEVEQAYNDFVEDIARADVPALIDAFDDEVCVVTTQGFVRVGFRCAVWAALRASDFEEAAISVVQLGGDSDTNGAIASAVLGARFGLKAIPGVWIDRVLGYGAAKGGESVGAAYQPQQFFAHVARWISADLLNDRPLSS